MNSTGPHHGNGENHKALRTLGKNTPGGNGSGDNRVTANLITFQTADGFEFQSAPHRIQRHMAVFELYNPGAVLQFSQVLSDFKIVLRDRTVYAGRAVVRHVVNEGLNLVCEATLDDASWLDMDFGQLLHPDGYFAREFNFFLGEWQKFYKVLPEYKIIVADMQTFFSDLRLWLEQVELGIRSLPSGSRQQTEQDVTAELADVILPPIDDLFAKFETVAEAVEPDQKAAHACYLRRQLHPLVLSAPFAHRTFYKPLGYAGDYEMVNMIARNGQEGGSLFAKIVNCWFLRQPPARAHRNRLKYLAERMKDETLRAARGSRPVRVFNFACGPAVEMQRFLAESPLSNHVELTLADFNRETLDYLKQAFHAVQGRAGRPATIQIQKKAVHQLLKESLRPAIAGDKTRAEYDFVYCAGLFDYLADATCKQLMEILYERLAPGGMLVATNVDPSNPLRNGMAYLLDWHLVYRTARDLRQLKPDRAPEDALAVRADETGVNLFLEIRKPGHG